MLQGGLSPLGRIYMEKVQKGEICCCMIHGGKLCNKCKEKEKERLVENRYKSINNIKNKIK